MARIEKGFEGAHLVGVTIDGAAADEETGIDAGTLDAQLAALAARVQALEDAAA